MFMFIPDFSDNHDQNNTLNNNTHEYEYDLLF